eukprot:Lithocolla_globosa_v1_NODE_2580_length_1946_cov_20.866737.p3 type:complete len:125 gc:universal NODE_2580_length_1946_cov_20.866737:1833-1459(-)
MVICERQEKDIYCRCLLNLGEGSLEPLGSPAVDPRLGTGRIVHTVGNAAPTQVIRQPALGWHVLERTRAGPGVSIIVHHIDVSDIIGDGPRCLAAHGIVPHHRFSLHHRLKFRETLAGACIRVP